MFSNTLFKTVSKNAAQKVCHAQASYQRTKHILVQNHHPRQLSHQRNIQYISNCAATTCKKNIFFNDIVKFDRQKLKETNNYLQGCLIQKQSRNYHVLTAHLRDKKSSTSFHILTMDRGIEQSFMVNRVVTGDSIQKFSPERTSTKSNSTNSSNSAIGAQDKKTPFLIGVAGGTASGKTTVCERIIEAVTGHQDFGHERQVISLSQDSFYRELTGSESKKAEKGLFNFDHPDAFDHDLMLSCLADIRAGKQTKIPEYDYKTNSRVKDKFTIIHPSDVVLLEGILVFYHKDVMDMFDMKLFVDTDADTRLARRVLRDIEDRGRDLEHVLHQYTTLVKPAFEEFCLPTKKHADVIIPRGADNTVAITLISQHITDILSGNGHRCKKRRRSSTLIDESESDQIPSDHHYPYQPNTSTSNGSGRPHFVSDVPRRPMSSCLSLPAGGSNLMTLRAERTPPRFLNEENNPHDLDPFQEQVLRHLGDSSFQMRPH